MKRKLIVPNWIFREAQVPIMEELKPLLDTHCYNPRKFSPEMHNKMLDLLIRFGKIEELRELHRQAGKKQANKNHK